MRRRRFGAPWRGGPGWLVAAGASIVLSASLAPSCKPADSLIQIDVQSDTLLADTQVALVVNGGMPKMYSGVTFGPGEPFHAGLYVAGTLVGTLAVDAIVSDGATGACLAKGAASVFDVAAGRVVPPTTVQVAPQPDGCEGVAPPVPDGGSTASGGRVVETGGTAGLPGRGGATGGSVAGAIGSGGLGGRGGQTGGSAGRSAGGTPGGSAGRTGAGGLPIGAGGTIVVATGGAPGSGGMVAGSGGMITGSGGMAGAGGNLGSGGGAVMGCGITPALIDDFEDGDGSICASVGRSGHWFTYVDGVSSSSVTPPPSDAVAASPTKLSTPRGASQYAMHITGNDSQYAGVGAFLDNPVIGQAPGVYDAGAAGYTGVHFFIKSNMGLYFVIQIPATVAVKYGGTCATEPCSGASYYRSSVALPSSATWTEISIPFSSLGGGVAPFRTDQLWDIGFQPGTAGSFDLWIDDVSFY